jgi:fluoride exporter
MAPGEKTAGPVEGVVAVAPVAERLVLDPPAALVELRVRQLQDVQRVRDLARVREVVGEGLPVWPGEVEHAPDDAGPPRLGLGRDPRRGPAAVRPGTTSSGCDGRATSTLEVHQCCRRHRPVRAKSVSSRPSALTAPMRAGLVDLAVQHRTRPAMPLGTLVVNTTGSFALGVLAGLALYHGLDDTPRLVIGIGYIGAYTTFSTFTYETIQLIDHGARLDALLNTVLSVVLRLLAAGTGLVLAGAL